MEIQNKHWGPIAGTLAMLAHAAISKVTSVELQLEFNSEHKAADMGDEIIKFDAALLVASTQNDKALVLLSLEQGADIIPAVTEGYSTALQAATKRGDRKIVNSLLDNGATVGNDEKEWPSSFTINYN
ncbi:hypothetical protein MMC07_002259 [Pseudocyphellaria aurata]|nr:hypothetical protein [Pseudocyphellaria aurata]